MSLGINLPLAEKSAFGGTLRWSGLHEMATLPEDIGLDGVSIVDHSFHRSADRSSVRGFWEAGTIATALAVATTSLRVSIMVVGSQFRHPIHLVKMAETISEVGDGRFILGLAAGGNLADFEVTGIPTTHRSSRFGDAIELIHPLLKRGNVDHHGRAYTPNDAYHQPRDPMAEQWECRW